MHAITGVRMRQPLMLVGMVGGRPGEPVTQSRNSSVRGRLQLIIPRRREQSAVPGDNAL